MSDKHGEEHPAAVHTTTKVCVRCGEGFTVQQLVAPRVTHCPPCRTSRDAARLHDRRASREEEDERAAMPTMVAICLSDRWRNGRPFYQSLGG